MQVSIETTSGLERKMTVGVPADVIDSEVNKRLQKAAKEVRINGFRKGKVPMKIVRQRFGAGVRQEVLGDAINRTLQEALMKEAVRPAGQPSVEPKQFEEGKDLEYIAIFEVYPEIDVKTIEGTNITRFSAEISEDDIDKMIETLRENQATWEDVEREAQDGDRVEIDFIGKKDGEAFDGGSAEGHILVLGSKSMIPGFEEGIVGMKIGEEKVLELTFPEDYQVESLKGAETEFSVTLKKVTAKKLAEANEEFFKSFGIEEGGLEAFREDVKQNMEREKEKIIQNRLKTQVLDALLAANEVEVPKALVLSEIEALREQTVQQYGQMNPNLDFKSLLPDDLFREKAERRVALGLLVGEVVNKEAIQVDQDRVKAFLQNIASTYEDPESVVNYYMSNRDLLGNVESVVLEDQVVDKLLETATVEDKEVPYQDLIKPTPEEEAEA